MSEKLLDSEIFMTFVRKFIVFNYFIGYHYPLLLSYKPETEHYYQSKYYRLL